MGEIKQNALEKYFSRRPIEMKMMKPFLSCFSINYADEQHVANTELSFFILEPDEHIKEAFGLEKELAAFYSPYDNMEPRTIQGLEYLLKSYPLKKRVDGLNYFLISDAVDISAWLSTFYFENENNNIMIPFYSGELTGAPDSWFVRNRMREHCYAADLFGYTLPLNDDLFFFGRQKMLSRYVDAVRRGENRGVFGLRKTGKTSFLNKIQRTINEQQIGYSLFYDCKLPEYRNMHWEDLISEICNDVVNITDNYYDILVYDNPGKSFRLLMKKLHEEKKRLILIFDEIEFISLRAIQNPHWQTESLDFWQTLWSVQSQYRSFVFIISGVNPSSVEIDKVNGVQNPLFGIVQTEYLQGLADDEIRLMASKLGKRMGLKFNHEACSCLFALYGGHPMLTRLACSWLNTAFSDTNRPVLITEEVINSNQEQIELDLVYYFKHVVSEIKEFYPDEYEMFELLASGQVHDFIELSAVSEFVQHLYSYGLISKDSDNMPKVRLPVAAKCVALELAQREGRTSAYKMPELDKRQDRVHHFCSSILRDMRLLEKAIMASKLPLLFGVNSFTEADVFIGTKEVRTQTDFNSFINICNRCFVETVVNYGNEKGETNYFWGTIKSSYPTLFKQLEKIKVYRHDADHIVLNKVTSDKLRLYLEEDLPKDVPEVDMYFCLQQKILEDLLICIQIELNKLA